MVIVVSSEPAFENVAGPIKPGAVAVDRRSTMTAAIQPLPRPGLSRTAVLWCVALGTFTVPIAFGPARYGFDPARGYSLTMWVGLIDVMLALALILGGRSTLRRIRARTSSTFVDAGTLLLIGLTISTLIHPVDRGVGILIRLAGAIVVADWFASADRQLLATLGKIVATLGLFQWVLSFAQLARNGPTGLWFLGERSMPLFAFGDSVGAAGTFFHCYLLAGFLAVAMGTTNSLALRGIVSKRLSLALSVAGTSSAFFAFSRVSVLSAVLVGGSMTLVAVFDRKNRRFAAASMAAMILTALVSLAATRSGWTTKAEYVTKFGATTGRTELLRQNVDTFLRHPWVGVGTGRYTMSLLDEGRDLGETPHPPHMIPLAALTEGGLLSAPSLLAHVGAIALLMWRRHWSSVVAVATLLSPFMLEQFMWNTPEGMMMVAIGLGAAGAGTRWRQSAPSDSLDGEVLREVEAAAEHSEVEAAAEHREVEAAASGL